MFSREIFTEYIPAIATVEREQTTHEIWHIYHLHLDGQPAVIGDRALCGHVKRTPGLRGPAGRRDCPACVVCADLWDGGGR